MPPLKLLLKLLKLLTSFSLFILIFTAEYAENAENQEDYPYFFKINDSLNVYIKFSFLFISVHSAISAVNKCHFYPSDNKPIVDTVNRISY